MDASFAASLEQRNRCGEHFIMGITSDTVAQTSFIQASTLMYPHPMKPFGDFMMSRGARLVISLSNRPIKITGISNYWW